MIEFNLWISDNIVISSSVPVTSLAPVEKWTSGEFVLRANLINIKFFPMSSIKAIVYNYGVDLDYMGKLEQYAAISGLDLERGPFGRNPIITLRDSNDLMLFRMIFS
jgi:hypothetical protein